MNHPGKEPSHMTETEFAEAVDHVLSVASARLCSRLYQEAELYVKAKDDFHDGVPIARLARILLTTLIYMTVCVTVSQFAVTLSNSQSHNKGKEI